MEVFDLWVGIIDFVGFYLEFGGCLCVDFDEVVVEVFVG